jgi:hypothetical protein
MEALYHAAVGVPRFKALQLLPGQLANVLTLVNRWCHGRSRRQFSRLRGERILAPGGGVSAMLEHSYSGQD